MWITESLCCIAGSGQHCKLTILQLKIQKHAYTNTTILLSRTSVVQEIQGASVTQLGSLLIISQGWYEVVRWAVSFSGDGSTSKLISGS